MTVSQRSGEMELEAKDPGFEASVVVRTINYFVRDPKSAVNTACNDYSDVETWIASQAGQSGAVGATAALAPLMSVARVARTPITVVAYYLLSMLDFAVLVHKIAYVCPGVAGLRKCPVDKESSAIDLAIILALWTGAVHEEDLELLFEAQVRNGTVKVPDQRKISPKNEFLECPLQTSSEIIVVDKGGTKMLAMLGALFLRKLARAIFLRIGSRELAKMALGLSIVGAAACTAINYKIVSDVGHNADKYYIRKRAFLDRMEGE